MLLQQFLIVCGKINKVRFLYISFIQHKMLLMPGQQVFICQSSKAKPFWSILYFETQLIAISDFVQKECFVFMLQDILINKVSYSEFPATSSELNSDREHHHRLLFVLMVKFSGQQMVFRCLFLQNVVEGGGSQCSLHSHFFVHSPPPISCRGFYRKKKFKSWASSRVIKLN